MELNLEPVKVDLQIETPSLERGAFYNLCFITENDEAPRTLRVERLRDLLDNGYDRVSLAYNFCVGVFAQQGIESIYIRAKRSYETYKEAFSTDSNNDYYYLVIESKDSQVISDFNNFVVASDDYKLQFYSSNEDPVEGRKLVHYFFERGSDKRDFYLSKVMGEPDYIEDSLSPVELQQQRLAYPEAAWIASCGNHFPSRVNWLHKYLSKVDVIKRDATSKVPPLSTTTSEVMKIRATVGSGTTTYGIPIHEKISLDWVKWALGRRVWNTLYTKEKVNATQGGLELISNEVKAVLEVAVTENIFTDYRITNTSLNRNTNTISVKFEANLSYTILEVELSGSLYY